MVYFTNMPGPHIHQRELRKLGGFVVGMGGLACLTYLHPIGHDIRPWIPGEPIPLLRFVNATEHVSEDGFGELSESPILSVEATPTDSSGTESTVVPVPNRLPVREPAVPTALENPEALFPFFEALENTAAGQSERITRVLHWGDSLIAADGITGQLRVRFQSRFGDGGPGFLPVHVDPRWGYRPHILRWQEGDWNTLNITFAGAQTPRYGLAGLVSTADEAAKVVLGGPKGPDGERQPIHRFDLFYQIQPNGGSFFAKPRNQRGKHASTQSDHVGDRFMTIESEEGATTFSITTQGDGPVTIYGVALETTGPGVTWETFGVAGSSTASMLAYQGKRHLHKQVSQRKPDLVVYETGGNELGYHTLTEGDGEQYQANYLKALHKIWDGAPEGTPCLIVSPIDQATRVRGQITSKPTITKMVEVQRRAAQEAGCAFWDAHHAMGGEGAFQRWLQHDPPYAWSDLIHLSTEGLDLMGDSLADAILDAYDQWHNARVGSL